MQKPWLAAPLLFLASAMVLSLVYQQYNFSGKWLSGPAPSSWSGDALTLSKGQGYSGKDKLVIEGLEGEVAVASLSLPGFQAEDFAFVDWTITGMTPGVEMEFLWRTAENRVFKRPLTWTGDVAAPLQMAGDKSWRGQIAGLALVVKGRLAAPMTIKGVSLLSARAALPIMIKKWFVIERWQATSINFIDGDAIEQDVVPVTAIAAIALLALVLYWGSAKYKIAPLNVAVIWGVVFLGWLALDIRWQTNLLRQLDLTRQQFAGKSWEEKHLAAEDGALFDFMRQARAKLPAAPGRILYFSDDDFLRGRGAYHLLPRNVLADNALPKAAQFKAGDIVVLYAKKNAGYDSARQVLTWDDQSLQADALILAGSNAMLRVR
jgi:hypothetical protein